MARPENPGDGGTNPGGGGYNPPIKNTTGVTNPGLINSTGGLFGNTGLLLTPYVNIITGNCYVFVHDPNNFDCEESSEYDYPQVIPPEQAPQEGRNVSCHLIILKYREIGVCTFGINLTMYQKTKDIFTTKSFAVNIANTNKRASFPDNRIHTRFIGLTPVFTGERPYLSITRNANSGPYSVTKMILCGNADEAPQL